MADAGLDAWRSTAGKHESWVLLLAYNAVLLHTCGSFGVTEVFEVHIFIDEIQLCESCCDVNEDMSMLSRNYL